VLDQYVFVADPALNTGKQNSKHRQASNCINNPYPLLSGRCLGIYHLQSYFWKFQAMAVSDDGIRNYVGRRCE